MVPDCNSCSQFPNKLYRCWLAMLQPPALEQNQRKSLELLCQTLPDPGCQPVTPDITAIDLSFQASPSVFSHWKYWEW